MIAPKKTAASATDASKNSLSQGPKVSRTVPASFPPGGVRSSTRRSTVENKLATQTKLQEAEARRASVKARPVKRVKHMTQDALIREALEMEEENTRSLLHYLEQEEERKTRQRQAGKKELQGPFLRWISVGLLQNKFVSQVEGTHGQASSKGQEVRKEKAKQGESKPGQDALPLLSDEQSQDTPSSHPSHELDKKHFEQQGILPVQTRSNESSTPTTVHSNPPPDTLTLQDSGSATRSDVGLAADPHPSPHSIEVPTEGNAEACQAIQSQHAPDPNLKPSTSSSVHSDQTHPFIHTPPTRQCTTPPVSVTTQREPNDTQDSLSTSTHAGTPSQTLADPAANASSSAQSHGDALSHNNEALVNQDTPVDNSRATRPVADEITARTLISLHGLEPDATWVDEFRYLLGDHCAWDRIPFVPSRNRPFRPRQSTCVITGLPARYRDPRTGIPYATTEAFAMLRRILAGEFLWTGSPQSGVALSAGCYAAAHGDGGAGGVFLDM